MDCAPAACDDTVAQVRLAQDLARWTSADDDDIVIGTNYLPIRSAEPDRQQRRRVERPLPVSGERAPDDPDP